MKYNTRQEKTRQGDVSGYISNPILRDSFLRAYKTNRREKGSGLVATTLGLGNTVWNGYNTAKDLYTKARDKLCSFIRSR